MQLFLQQLPRAHAKECPRHDARGAGQVGYKVRNKRAGCHGDVVTVVGWLWAVTGVVQVRV